MGFRKVDTLGRLRLIRAGQPLGSEGLQLRWEVRFHGVLIHSIHARCVSATRRQRHASRFLQPGPVGNYPQKTVESTSFVFRGPCGQLALHFTGYQRSSPLYGPLICQAVCSNCSPSPCSRLSLPPTTTGTPPVYQTSGPHSLTIPIDLPQSTCWTQTYGGGCRSQSLPLLAASRYGYHGLTMLSPW